MPLLAVLVPGPIELDAGRIRTASKTITGMEAFAKHWPGDVVHLTEVRDSGEERPLGSVERALDKLPYSVIPTRDRLGTLRSLKPDVVLANLSLSELPVLEEFEGKVVINVENDLRNRVRWASLVEPPRKMPRVVAGLFRLEGRYRRALRRSVGIQANGWPAWEAYQALSARPMLYYDSRITSNHLKLNGEKENSSGFTVSFSGRWIEPKGFRQAIEAFKLAALQNSELVLHVFGSGPLSLPMDLPERVKVFGAVDFEDVWIPHVSREVDLMLLPYLQSDPAGTYLEGVSCGAPFLAFDNRQAKHLADHGLGWTTRQGDVQKLAAKLVEVSRSPGAVVRARAAGAEFMAKRTMEHEFARRAEHLLESSKA